MRVYVHHENNKYSLLYYGLNDVLFEVMWDGLTKYAEKSLNQASTLIAIGDEEVEGVINPKIFPPEDWYRYNEHTDALLPYLAGKALEFHPLDLNEIKPIVVLGRGAIGPRFEEMTMIEEGGASDIIDIAKSDDDEPVKKKAKTDY